MSRRPKLPPYLLFKIWPMKRWRYQETITSKYIHITHNFGYLLIFNGICFVLTTPCHHVCIARLNTRWVKWYLVEKVLFFLTDKLQNGELWGHFLDIFSEIWKELGSKSRGGQARGKGGLVVTEWAKWGVGWCPEVGSSPREYGTYFRPKRDARHGRPGAFIYF